MSKKKCSFSKPSLAWPTVQRLSEYLLILEHYINTGNEVISSSELADIYGNTASQVRQDIFRLQNTGRMGHGYSVKTLVNTIRRTLGLETGTNVIIVGCGKLGSAIAEHVPFNSYGMSLKGIFDKDPDIIGNRVSGLKVENVQFLTKAIKNRAVSLAALCVTHSSAQEVADMLVSAKIRGILNYTRKHLKVPSCVIVQDLQIICSFIQLAYVCGN